jgi:G:T-mismatch repair DNA endonuclease (very short patch repair protein)
MKIQKNRQRDKRVRRLLRAEGWRVLVIWEHSYEMHPDNTISKIVCFLLG